MKIFFYILIIFLLIGCSSSETIIKDRKIEVTVPAIKDSIPGSYKEFPKQVIESLDIIFEALPDSARVEGQKEIRTEKGKVKVSINVPEHKVDTTITDTTSMVVKKETTTPEKFGYATIGIIVFVIIAIVVFLGIKFKWV